MNVLRLVNQQGIYKLDEKLEFINGLHLKNFRLFEAAFVNFPIKNTKKKK